uniref:Uncharacterized protein n=1 Tax=Triticum urartu TaxID=4572 RepID=A0A8R7QU82_TRIUA
MLLMPHPDYTFLLFLFLGVERSHSRIKQMQF